jgi:ketopantoate reductase
MTIWLKRMRSSLGGANSIERAARVLTMGASPRFCIYGAGAVGGMIGTLLARAGATVSVVAHGETLAAVRHNGLGLIIGGETLQAQVRASAVPGELGIQDYVIVSVKAPALRAVAAEITPLLGPNTAVVTAMNGVPWWFFTHASGPLASARLPAIDPDGTIGNRATSCGDMPSHGPIASSWLMKTREAVKIATSAIIV